MGQNDQSGPCPVQNSRSSVSPDDASGLQTRTRCCTHHMTAPVPMKHASSYLCHHTHLNDLKHHAQHIHHQRNHNHVKHHGCKIHTMGNGKNNHFVNRRPQYSSASLQSPALCRRHADLFTQYQTASFVAYMANVELHMAHARLLAAPHNHRHHTRHSVGTPLHRLDAHHCKGTNSMHRDVIKQPDPLNEGKRATNHANCHKGLEELTTDPKQTQNSMEPNVPVYSEHAQQTYHSDHQRESDVLTTAKVNSSVPTVATALPDAEILESLKEKGIRLTTDPLSGVMIAEIDINSGNDDDNAVDDVSKLESLDDFISRHRNKVKHEVTGATSDTEQQNSSMDGDNGRGTNLRENLMSVEVCTSDGDDEETFWGDSGDGSDEPRMDITSLQSFLPAALESDALKFAADRMSQTLTQPLSMLKSVVSSAAVSAGVPPNFVGFSECSTAASSFTDREGPSSNSAEGFESSSEPGGCCTGDDESLPVQNSSRAFESGYHSDEPRAMSAFSHLGAKLIVLETPNGY